MPEVLIAYRGCYGMQHLLFSGFCSTVIRKTVASHLQCCEHGGWFSSTKQSLSSRNCFLSPPWLKLWGGWSFSGKHIPWMYGVNSFLPFFLFEGEQMRKAGSKAGLLWKTFICSREVNQSVQYSFVIVWLPDACHNPISPGFEPASINRGRYYYPCKEAELICCQRWGANSSLLLIPCPCPH